MLGAARSRSTGCAAERGVRTATLMPGRLVVCPTPIGNLEDVTLRVLSALREADVVACEDTRRTRVLLERYGVSASWSATTSTTSASARAELVERMQAGAIVALVSDAGMPLVSDPGFVLVQACVAAGLAVEVLPGPSAALAALVASALPAERWRFVGFLPRKSGELRRVVRDARDARRVRVAEAASRRRWRCWRRSTPQRPVAVCRELTKLHEEVVRGDGRRAGGALRGARRRAARSCSSSAPRRGGGSRARAGARARCAGSSRRARSRARPRRSSRS